ncbi:MAG: DegT/DnrJ/EryC1/StrS family aminotransferase [Rhodoferax sp.]|nr:DegT/DnrJ/EryC1/StrS family aminotransferase [Rhodoferax sp.]
MSSIALFHAYGDAATEAAALAVLRSGQIASGPKVAEFQLALQAWLGLPHAVTTTDMSSAMLLALHGCGVSTGDEVLSPAYTCMSSASPIANLGAKPRWVDVDPDTGLLDPAALRSRITARTKACVAYHAAGYPAAMPAIAAICQEHGIALIEDCNSALGARLHGQAVGAWGDAAVYSFYPNRQVNGIEGGAVAWRDPMKAQSAQRLRRFGIALSGFRDTLGEINAASDIAEVGWSAAPNQLNSAVALAQLPTLGTRLLATRVNAEGLAARLTGLPGLTVVARGHGAEPSYWGLLVLAERRDAVLAGLKRRGVMASKLHHRIDSYTGFAADPVDLPGTAAFLERVVALPCGHWLDATGLDHVAAALTQALQETQD